MSNDDDGYDVALRLLGRREHSTLELRKKLLTRGYSKKNIECVLHRLTENAYLSDERYTELAVRARLRKGDGPLKIRAYLLTHGVDDQLIEKHLPKDDEFWYARAVEGDSKNCTKHRFSSKSKNEFEARGIRARYLKNRGYPAAIISRVLNN